VGERGNTERERERRERVRERVWGSVTAARQQALHTGVGKDETKGRGKKVSHCITLIQKDKEKPSLLPKTQQRSSAAS
jgi:hypothetical protein